MYLPEGRRSSGKIQCSNDPLVYDLLKNPYYKVCSDGSVTTCMTKTGKVSVTGSWRVAGFIRKGHRVLKYYGKMLHIHRIVYAQYRGTLKDDLVVGHLDGNGLNNHPDNLILTTMSELNFKRFKTNPAVMGNTVLTWDIVREIRQLKKEHPRQYTHNMLARRYKTTKGHISQIVNNKIWIEGKLYAGKNP